MAFSDLSANYQQILIFNFEQFGKLFILFIMFSTFLIYRFYWKENKQQPTCLMSIAVLRYLLDLLSVICILVSPLFIILLSPEYSFWSFMVLVSGFINIAVVLGLGIFGFDVIKLGLGGAMEKVGMNTKDPQIKLFIKRMGTRGISYK